MSYMDQPPAAASAPAPTFTLAPWIKRVGATLVDGFIGNVISGIGRESHNRSIYALFTILGLAFWVWNTVIRQGKTGQSLGKSLLSIHLVNESDAQPVGPLKSFARQIAHILDCIPLFIGLLWPLWDPKRQTFADKVCKTVVVEDSRVAKAA